MALILSYFRQYFSHFFSHQEKDTKHPTAHISLTYIQVILLTLLIFFPYEPILQKYEFILFGFSLAWLRVFWFLIAPL